MANLANTGLETMVKLFGSMRPAGSKAERKMIREYILPTGARSDARGNLILRVGESAILWSCHTDTVHWKGGTQKVRIDSKGIISLAQGEPASCLGGDCTAGVWLMLEMIRLGKPGLYIFHRAEEIGGLGSSYIRDTTPELLDGIKFAIAFDRRGKKDVITHQGGRTCSDAFAESLAGELNKTGQEYLPDDTGSFTDTANYTTLVPECTNVSVGYSHAHSRTEIQDSVFLADLLHSVMAIDESALVESRKVTDPEYDARDWSSYAFDPYNYSADQDVFTLDSAKRVERRRILLDDFDYTTARKRKARVYDEVALLEDNAALVLEYLEHCGITADDIAAHVYDEGGVVRYV